LVVICYERDSDNFKTPVYLLSTDIELRAETVISYYQNRWGIETNYKYLKSNLGFDEYKVRSIISIERYFLLAFLTINFLEIYRLRVLNGEVPLGDALREITDNAFIALVCYIYNQAKEDIPLENLLTKLKLTP
jgi:IS4 transposase